MSSRHHERKKYSRSRSKSWSRQRHQRNRDKARERDIDRNRQRSRQRDRHQQKQRQLQRGRQREKERYYVNRRSRDRRDRDVDYKRKNDEGRQQKYAPKQSEISIDWRHRGYQKSKRYKSRHSSQSNSHSRSSSSSSSSSNSSSYQKLKSSRKNRGKKSSKQSQRHRQKNKQKNYSKSKSPRRSSRERKEGREQKKLDIYYKKHDNYKSSYYNNMPEHQSKPERNIAPQFSKGIEIMDKKDNGDQKRHNQGGEGVKGVQKREKIVEQTLVSEKQRKGEKLGMQNSVKCNKQGENWSQKQGASNTMDIEIGKKENEGQKSVGKATAFPQPLKRVEEPPLLTPIPEKQKISRVVQLLKQAKQNLEIPIFSPNFLILDSYRTMRKLNAQTLDPFLLASLKADLEQNLEREKGKVFNREMRVGEQRQDARLLIPEAPNDEQLSLLTEIESLKGSMMNLNLLFRQLHVLE